MTKAELVDQISSKVELDKGSILKVVEGTMDAIKETMESGENVYLRGFGSFIVKYRAPKTGRNISKNTSVSIPAHHIPAFKPAKVFVSGVKTNVKVK